MDVCTYHVRYVEILLTWGFRSGRYLLRWSNKSYVRSFVTTSKMIDANSIDAASGNQMRRVKNVTCTHQFSYHEQNRLSLNTLSSSLPTYSYAPGSCLSYPRISQSIYILPHLPSYLQDSVPPPKKIVEGTYFHLTILPASLLLFILILSPSILHTHTHTHIQCNPILAPNILAPKIHPPLQPPPQQNPAPPPHETVNHPFQQRYNYYSYSNRSSSSSPPI